MANVLVASDSFTRPDGSLGANWSVILGSWSIASHLAVATGGANNIASWAGAGSFTDNQYAKATGTPIGGFIGVSLQNAGGNWYDIALQTGTGQYYLRKNGSDLTSGTTSAPGAGAVIELDLN